MFDDGTQQQQQQQHSDGFGNVTNYNSNQNNSNNNRTIHGGGAAAAADDDNKNDDGDDHCVHLAPVCCCGRRCSNNRWCTLSTMGLVWSFALFILTVVASATPWFSRVETFNLPPSPTTTTVLTCQRVIVTGWQTESCTSTCVDTSPYRCGVASTNWYDSCAAASVLSVNASSVARLSRIVEPSLLAHVSSTCDLEIHIYTTCYWLQIIAVLGATFLFVYYAGIFSLTYCRRSLHTQQASKITRYMERCRNAPYPIAIAMLGAVCQFIACVYFGSGIPLTDMGSNSHTQQSVPLFGSADTHYGTLQWGANGWTVSVLICVFYVGMFGCVCLSSIVLVKRKWWAPGGERHVDILRVDLASSSNSSSPSSSPSSSNSNNNNNTAHHHTLTTPLLERKSITITSSGGGGGGKTYGTR